MTLIMFQGSLGRLLQVFAHSPNIFRGLPAFSVFFGQLIADVLCHLFVSGSGEVICSAFPKRPALGAGPGTWTPGASTDLRRRGFVLLFGTLGVLLATFDQTELAMICVSLAPWNAGGCMSMPAHQFGGETSMPGARSFAWGSRISAFGVVL